MIQCRFSEFLIQLCIKIRFFLVRAEILLSRDKVSLESRARPFLGSVQKYKFLEKYSPLLSYKKTLFLGFRAEILLLCAEILPFLGSVQKYYDPGTRGCWILVQGHFWGLCRYIRFWRNIHLWLWVARDVWTWVMSSHHSRKKANWRLHRVFNLLEKGTKE